MPAGQEGGYITLTYKGEKCLLLWEKDGNGGIYADSLVTKKQDILKLGETINADALNIKGIPIKQQQFFIENPDAFCKENPNIEFFTYVDYELDFQNPANKNKQKRFGICRLLEKCHGDTLSQYALNKTNKKMLKKMKEVVVVTDQELFLLQEQLKTINTTSNLSARIVVLLKMTNLIEQATSELEIQPEILTELQTYLSKHLQLAFVEILNEIFLDHEDPNLKVSPRQQAASIALAEKRVEAIIGGFDPKNLPAFFQKSLEKKKYLPEYKELYAQLVEIVRAGGKSRRADRYALCELKSELEQLKFEQLNGEVNLEQQNEKTKMDGFSHLGFIPLKTILNSILNPRSEPKEIGTLRKALEKIIIHCMENSGGNPLRFIKERHIESFKALVQDNLLPGIDNYEKPTKTNLRKLEEKKKAFQEKFKVWHLEAKKNINESDFSSLDDSKESKQTLSTNEYLIEEESESISSSSEEIVDPAEKKKDPKKKIKKGDDHDSDSDSELKVEKSGVLTSDQEILKAAFYSCLNATSYKNTYQSELEALNGEVAEARKENKLLVTQEYILNLKNKKDRITILELIAQRRILILRFFKLIKMAFLKENRDLNSINEHLVAAAEQALGNQFLDRDLDDQLDPQDQALLLTIFSCSKEDMPSCLRDVMDAAQALREERINAIAAGFSWSKLPESLRAVLSGQKEQYRKWRKELRTNINKTDEWMRNIKREYAIYQSDVKSEKNQEDPGVYSNYVSLQSIVDLTIIHDPAKLRVQLKELLLKHFIDKKLIDFLNNEDSMLSEINKIRNDEKKLYVNTEHEEALRFFMRSQLKIREPEKKWDDKKLEKKSQEEKELKEQIQKEKENAKKLVLEAKELKEKALEKKVMEELAPKVQALEEEIKALEEKAKKQGEKAKTRELALETKAKARELALEAKALREKALEEKILEKVVASAKALEEKAKTPEEKARGLAAKALKEQILEAKALEEKAKAMEENTKTPEEKETARDLAAKAKALKEQVLEEIVVEKVAPEAKALKEKAKVMGENAKTPEEKDKARDLALEAEALKETALEERELVLGEERRLVLEIEKELMLKKLAPKAVELEAKAAALEAKALQLKVKAKEHALAEAKILKENALKEKELALEKLAPEAKALEIKAEALEKNTDMLKKDAEKITKVIEKYYSKNVKKSIEKKLKPHLIKLTEEWQGGVLTKILPDERKKKDPSTVEGRALLNVVPKAGL